MDKGKSDWSISLENRIRECVQKINLEGSERQTLVVNRRTKHLSEGDFCVPRGCYDIKSEDFPVLKENILDRSKVWPIPVKDVKSDLYNSVLVFLDRTSTYKQVLTSLLKDDNLQQFSSQTSDVPNRSEHGDSFSSSVDSDFELDVHSRYQEKVLVNNMDLCSSSYTMENLRSLILMQHIIQLLNINRIKTELVKCKMSENTQKWLDLISFNVNNVDQLPWQPTTDTVIKLAETSPYRDIQSSSSSRCESCLKRQTLLKSEPLPKEETISSDPTEDEMCSSQDTSGVTDSSQCSGEGTHSSQQIDGGTQTSQCTGVETLSKAAYFETCSCATISCQIVLNIDKFLNSSCVKRGKNHYNKNLSTVNIKNVQGPTDISAHIAQLSDSLQKIAKCSHILHITEDRKRFYQQKVDVAWRIIDSTIPRQIHLLYGSVQERKSQKQKTMSAEEFFQFRFHQMKEASKMKYGDRVKGPGWDKTIEQLTMASIKFEFLNNVARNPVKVDLSEGNEFGGGVDNRAGAFVMYNCARLATLFKHFRNEVEKGVYPDLPNIDKIDFSLLREEDEWSLFFLYVFPYTDIVTSTVHDFIPGDDTIYTKINTHKISNFLIGLSRNLSCYYSRVHILVENRQHLLPIMFARLYLLKAVHHIMKTSLHLMGITPPNQL